MNVNLPETLRRGADFLQDMHRKQHPDIHILWTPWYIEAMREAAEELERHQEVFNEDALLRMTGQYLGTTPERLREMAQADKEGRLVVLPCKVGDTVWFIRPLDSKREITETTVEKIVAKEKGLYVKLACNAMYETSCNSIGKTVFLTQEDAEAALAKGGNRDA